MDIAWRNGAYLPRTELVVGIDAAALRYAAVIFDGLRCHIHRPNARCARLLGLPRHLARFARSCEALSLPLIFNASELREAVRGVIRRCRPERSCGVRLFAFSESERFDEDNTATNHQRQNRLQQLPANRPCERNRGIQVSIKIRWLLELHTLLHKANVRTPAKRLQTKCTVGALHRPD